MKLVQEQTQKTIQGQRLSGQQIMLVRLLSMPLAELEENVRMEMDDNPALEVEENEEHDPATDMSHDEGNEDVLWDGEDGIWDGTKNSATEVVGTGRTGEMVWGTQTSFYDKLQEQIGEEDLSDDERYVLEYLIGSLDEDGLLRKPLDAISDELAVYHNIDVSIDDVELMLKVLQGFDPPGIGARSLKECLLIQIGDRSEKQDGAKDETHELMRRVISDYYDDFIQNRWEAIAGHLGIDEERMEEVRHEILKLNPKPGASLDETEGRNIHQITPDFIVDTADDGTVTFSINNGRVPELCISESFAAMLAQDRGARRENRREQEALLYARQKVERANNYISALKQRHMTLYLTMKTIIDIQRKFFQEGDEADLKPMVLKDVAERTGYDISTISRVCNEKYAQTRWGTYRLRFFFSDGISIGGEEMSTRRLKIVLKEIVDEEDKSHPLSDEEIARQMKDMGLPIARRTVSKYREQLGIPTARMRK